MEKNRLLETAEVKMGRGGEVTVGSIEECLLMTT